MIGFAGAPREPSLVWHAAQTEAEIAAPLAESGGGAAAGSAACAAMPVDASASEQRKRDAGFMKAPGSRAKASDFTMSPSPAPHEHLIADFCGPPGIGGRQRPGAHGARLDPHGALPHHGEQPG